MDKSRLLLWLGIVAFAAVMLVVHYIVAPWLVERYGLLGVGGWFGLMLYLGARL